MIRRSCQAETAGVLLAAVVLVAYFTFPLAIYPASRGRIDGGAGQFRHPWLYEIIGWAHEVSDMRPSAGAAR